MEVVFASSVNEKSQTSNQVEANNTTKISKKYDFEERNKSVTITPLNSPANNTPQIKGPMDMHVVTRAKTIKNKKSTKSKN